jgi:glycosyltransferase involved in cell wall biosynthesis
MRLIVEKIKNAILKRTKAAPQKSYAAWLAKGYNDTPLVSVIIQSHNKSLQVCHILPKLRQYKNIEIVVIDDGSSFDHTQRLAKALTGANEFLVRANDLYENRTYDKAIRFSNGKYIALLQDDDDFEGTQWIDDAVHYFEKFPKMAILGGKWAVEVFFDASTKGIRHTSTDTGSEKFRFAPVVNRAPMWINRELFAQHLHSIDFSLAPFQYDDDELCLRAWLCGLQVGWYDARFKSLTVGGMRIWNNSFAKEQVERNGKLLYQMYADKIEQIKDIVAANNG